jgi:hypothetical protein
VGASKQHDVVSKKGIRFDSNSSRVYVEKGIDDLRCRIDAHTSRVTEDKGLVEYDLPNMAVEPLNEW